MGSELLPDACNPMLIEQAVFLPVYARALKTRSEARAMRNELESSTDQLLAPLRRESASLRMRIYVLGVVLSLLRSGLNVDESVEAVRRLLRQEIEENRRTESLPSQAGGVDQGVAKRAFRIIASATHPDRVTFTDLLRFVAVGVQREDLFAEALEAQKCGDVDGLVALGLFVAHVAADAALAGDTLGLAHHEELAYLHSALEALCLEITALQTSELVRACVPGSNPARPNTQYAARLVAQERAAVAALRSRGSGLAGEVSTVNPNALAAVDHVLEEYGI